VDEVPTFQLANSGGAEGLPPPNRKADRNSENPLGYCVAAARNSGYCIPKSALNWPSKGKNAAYYEPILGCVFYLGLLLRSPGGQQMKS